MPKQIPFWQELENNWKPKKQPSQDNNQKNHPSQPKQREFQPEKQSNPCETCKFRCDHQPVKGMGVNGKLMFVGMYPGDEEIKQGKPFVGNSGQYFRQVAKEIGIDLDTEAYLTNILRCKPKGEVSVKDVKACGKKLLEEMHQVNPQYIVLMGELPFKFFFPKQLTRYRGMMLSKGEFKFFPTHNPAHLSREKEGSQDRKLFEQDLGRLYAAYRGVQTEREGIIKKLCRTYEDVDTQLDELRTVDNFVLDIESYAPGKLKDKTMLDPWAKGFQITTISFAYYLGGKIKAFCIPLEHPDNKMDVASLVEVLLVMFGESKQGIIGQNIKWDLKCLEVHFKIKINTIVFETLIAHSLLVGKRGKGAHTLERMSVDYLNTDSYKELLRTEKEFTIAPIESLSDMNMDDCINTLELATRFERQLKDVDRLWEYYKNQVIVPAIKPLKNMEVQGMLVDMPYLKKIEEDTKKSIEQVEEKLLSYSELVGKGLSLTSNQDLNTILFDIFKFDPPERKTTLGYAVDKPVLDALSKKYQHPFLSDLLELKAQQKLHSTYILPYLRKNFGQGKWGEIGTGHVKFDGRVHSQFNQHVAITGRLSSENPNVQNLPVRSGSLILRMFIAPPGYKLVVADFSQIELRILAAYSGEQAFIEAFANDEDIHSKTASEIFHVPIDQVTKAQRAKAKSVNFGIIYGISEVGLAVQIGCTEEEAREIIKAYLEKLPFVKEYMEKMKTQMYKKGYVLSLFGRRIYITGKRNSERERQSINGPIQGTASDVNQMALIKVTDLIEEYSREIPLYIFPNNIIHDSIISEVRDDQVEFSQEFIKDTMEGLELPFDMRGIALKADIGVGTNFSEAK